MTFDRFFPDCVGDQLGASPQTPGMFMERGRTGSVGL